MTIAPFYADESVALYCGDFRDVLPELDVRADLLVADPPYGETRLAWDQWPEGWPVAAAAFGSSMWVFGSMRMYLDHVGEFDGWTLSQDVVWEKHNGSGLRTDRFRRVHETATHWYRGPWSVIHHVTPTTPDATARTVRKKARPAHWIGEVGASTYESVDGGPRLMRSVLFARSEHGQAINETQKPTGLLEPLIEYGCPPGGLVVDIFAGGGSTGIAARALGRRAILVELREAQCEATARRLAQGSFELAGR